MVGQTPDSILEAMKSSGFSEAHSLDEINLAIESPYLKGSKLLLDRLKKRDWQLAVYRKCNRLHPASAEIERRHRLTRQDFLPRVLQHQQARDHHRHDGRLAGAAKSGTSISSARNSANA